MTTRAGSSRFAEPPASKREPSTRPYYSDLERVAAMTDDDIDLEDSPEITAEMLSRAVVDPGKPAMRVRFFVDVPEALHRWYEEAPEGCREALTAALTEYAERHPRS